MNFKVSRFCEHERHRKLTRRTRWQMIGWSISWHVKARIWLFSDIWNIDSIQPKMQDTTSRYKEVKMAFQFAFIDDVFSCVSQRFSQNGMTSVTSRRPLWWMWVAPMSRRSSVLITIKRASLRRTQRCKVAMHFLVWTGCEQQQQQQQFSTIITPERWPIFRGYVSFREGSPLVSICTQTSGTTCEKWEKKR